MVDADLVTWLASGERGISSNSIVQYCCQIDCGVRRIDIPYDPDDLRRCRLLLEAVPCVNQRFGLMETASTVWERYVRNWEKLCRIMDDEAPEWRRGIGTCHLTYAEMRTIREV
jgi:hypothetical protein